MDEQHRSSAKGGGARGRQVVRLVVGLGIPFCVIDLAIPFTTRVDRTVLGAAFPVFWMFLSFVVTSACMLATWLLFDRADEAGEEHDAGIAAPERGE
ncbi:DUF3311 domain-containing protein [Gluconacetobacter sp.]|uniref:DUF3311 domain-containing protein n=1 Tax=Gluconacetobacter sp. TaxID=1935994 RepID=UPI0039EC642C